LFRVVKSMVCGVDWWLVQTPPSWLCAVRCQPRQCPGADVDGEGLPALCERCRTRGCHLPSPPPSAVPVMSRGVLTTGLLWMCTCVLSCKGSILHPSHLVSSPNRGMEPRDYPVCSKPFASSQERSDPPGLIPAFVLPPFCFLFFFFVWGGKEILLSQRGQGARLLPGGRSRERAASPGLRGNNLLTFLTFLLLSLSFEIMKITSFSHC